MARMRTPDGLPDDAVDPSVNPMAGVPDPSHPLMEFGIEGTPTGLRSGETPRERLPDVTMRGPMPPPGMSGGIPASPGGPAAPSAPQATPGRPSEPTPQAGSVSPGGAPGGPAGPGAPGLSPFDPMSGPSPVSMAAPRLRGLFGSSGGLTGGGLGVPLDPTNNSASDPISSLIQSLIGQGPRRR